MNRTRAEHIQFCKENAYRQYEFDLSDNEFANYENAIQNACATMISDLAKHPETEELASLFIFNIMFIDTPEKMRSFIDGFN